jgi:hypothetical protein
LCAETLNAPWISVPFLRPFWICAVDKCYQTRWSLVLNEKWQLKLKIPPHKQSFHVLLPLEQTTYPIIQEHRYNSQHNQQLYNKFSCCIFLPLSFFN